MSSTPSDEPLVFVGTSDGSLMPSGRFLVTVWPSGRAELAHKDPVLSHRSWSAPVALEVAP